MNNTQFKESEIPYGILAKFGLSQEMVEDLPEKVISDILGGRRSALLPIQVTDEKGDTVRACIRFQLVRGLDGSVDAVFYPKLSATDLERYGEADRQSLLDGHAIVASSAIHGKQVQCFHQIDPATNQILYVPTAVIGRNLDFVSKQLRLSAGELACLQKGMPLTMAIDDELATIGIDLTEQTGVRFADGDDKRWREERKQPFGKYSFGLNGCWIAGDDGELSYVSEENFTQELLDERAKIVNRRGMMTIK